MLRIAVLTCVVFIVALALLRVSQRSVAGMNLPIARSMAESFAYETINTAVMEYIEHDGMTLSELYSIDKNSSGQISAIMANVVSGNRVKTGLYNRILRHMDEMNDMSVPIPLSNFWGIDLLANLGPKIPVRFLFHGVPKMDFESSFTQAGINQTKHEVSLRAEVSINILLPGRTELVQVRSEIPLAQNIIVGDIPSAYANLSQRND